MLFLSNIRRDKFKKLQKINESKLEKFLEFFEYACYKLSWIINYNKNPIGGNNHTHGGVVDLLNRIKIPTETCENWLKDTEHGFFHGFCTLYMSYCLHPDKKGLWDDLHWYERRYDRGFPRFTYADNLIVSCLFHDMMRFHNDTEDDHDSRLCEITNHLLPETYTHSNPSEDSYLVSGDRLELMRFEDYKEWIDFSKLNSSIEAYGGMELIKHFYQHMRPVLERMFKDRNDIWFSHALEVRKFPIWKSVNEEKRPSDVLDNIGFSHYPGFHWVPLDEGYVSHMKPEYEKYFSVHSGKLPFENCLAHTKGYYRAQGIISRSQLKKYNCEISCAPPSTAGRDHLFIVANKDIPTYEWSFLYKNELELDQIEIIDLRTIKSSIFNKVYRCSELFLTNMMCLTYI